MHIGRENKMMMDAESNRCCKKAEREKNVKYSVIHVATKQRNHI
jgi:hypothetical protein